MTALPPKADKYQTSLVRPLSANSDIMQRSEIRGYSITPSARANTFGFWETGKTATS